jgi:hypothetical protein
MIMIQMRVSCVMDDSALVSVKNFVRVRGFDPRTRIIVPQVYDVFTAFCRRCSSLHTAYSIDIATIKRRRKRIKFPELRLCELCASID